MKWILLNNRIINVNDSKYKIDWDKPSKSGEQFKVKQFLKQYCKNHIIYEEYLLPRSGNLRVDFLNSTQKWAIEHQGVAHESYNSFFHKNSRLNFLQRIKNDVKKREILEKNGYIVIETITDDLPLSYDFFIGKFGIYL
ncbi:MAG: hypothetical protein AABY22_05040 [Nanoarchaeota archaeon]